MRQLCDIVSMYLTFIFDHYSVGRNMTIRYCMMKLANIIVIHLN